MNEKEKAFIESQQQYDLFYKTFGGTTFRHMITWFKSQVDQNKPRIQIYDFNLPHNHTLIKYKGQTAIENSGYYLKLREFRWSLPLFHEEEDGLKNTFEDFDFAYKVVSGKNHDDITISENASLSNKKIENIAIIYHFLKNNNIKNDKDLKFKGIDTDMFTPVFEYGYDYNLKNIKKGDLDIPSVSKLNYGILFENDDSRLNSLKLLYQELKKYLYPIELVKLENSWYAHINHNLQ